ncbi:ricin-type beta-trefoil lectin domain protein [Streptomyces sp. NPDC058625]|uniref:ricin-type beta-trefoil lectin domain protein n=1 Tax=Streptomyces sp. NPDC058625 TaxID=3346564 RepID=UPI0036500171
MGRPKAPMLAAAGIAGVVLLAVPLLIVAGNDRDEQPEDHATVAADSRALYDGREAQQPPGVYAAEPPKGDAQAGSSKDKDGKEAKDGKEEGKDDGKCLTASSRGAGAELVVQPCGASQGAQIWSFHDNDRTLRIGEDLCMGLDSGSVEKGTAIRLQRCNASAGQKFKINATEDLVSLKAGNKCAGMWSCTRRLDGRECLRRLGRPDPRQPARAYLPGSVPLHLEAWPHRRGYCRHRRHPRTGGETTSPCRPHQCGGQVLGVHDLPQRRSGSSGVLRWRASVRHLASAARQPRVTTLLPL